ncbi:hypothetical protein ALC62_11501, partial [Cyphomyrmex costatus]
YLRIIHSFYEGSQLNLKCYFLNCPSIFKTYSGFKKHLAKCKLNIEQVCTDNSNNSTEILNNIETLMFLIENSSFKKIIFNSFNEKIINRSKYNNFTGEMYKTNELFCNSEKLTIQIQIIFDEFEICNPLGSKTLSHKIGGFYFSICNLPPHFNSNLNNIHLLALYYNKDTKNFGINTILEIIVKDVKILETEGFYIGGLEYPVKGTVAVLSHDNLGGANIKLRSVLNNFGINLSMDIMHDFLDGICQLELKLFIKFLIQEKLASIEEINDKINCCSPRVLPQLSLAFQPSNELAEMQDYYCKATFAFRHSNDLRKCKAANSITRADNDH